jgi:hypothetical protein
MASTSYTPTNFGWQDWTDNVDRVQAGGNNGFNARFQALQAEFPLIADAIAQLNAALAALSQPPPSTVTRTLTPNLLTTAANGWAYLPGVAVKPPTQTAAHGMMPVELPNGATVQTLKATGIVTGAGSLRIALVRQGIAGDASATDQLVQLTPTGNPFSLVANAGAQFASVDTTQFRYYITALLDNAAAGDTVQIAAFQITYQTGS